MAFRSNNINEKLLGIYVRSAHPVELLWDFKAND
jgi:hypothetical protein